MERSVWLLLAVSGALAANEALIILDASCPLFVAHLTEVFAFVRRGKCASAVYYSRSC